jgi:hypothetical protein
MKHTSVSHSSNIRSFAYDPKSKVMEVAFSHPKGEDSLYEFYDVAPEHHPEMERLNQAGESVGKYFHANIRGKHGYLRKK